MSFRRTGRPSNEKTNFSVEAHPNKEAKGFEVKKMTRADMAREAQSDAQRERLLANGGFTFEMPDADADDGTVKPVTVQFALERPTYTYAGQDVPNPNRPNMEPKAGSARTGLTIEKPTPEEKRDSQVVVTAVGHTFESMTKNDIQVADDSVEVGAPVSKFRPDMADAPDVLRTAAKDKYTALMARRPEDLLPTEQRTLDALRPIVEAMNASKGLPGGYDNEWMPKGGYMATELRFKEHEAQEAEFDANYEAAVRDSIAARAKVEARQAEVIKRYEELRGREQAGEELHPREAAEMRKIRAEYYRAKGDENMARQARAWEAKDVYGTVPRTATTMIQEAGGFLVRDGKGGADTRAGAVVIEPVMDGATQTGWRVAATENTTIVSPGQVLPLDLSGPKNADILNAVLSYDRFAAQRAADGFPHGRYVQQIGEAARGVIKADQDKKAAGRAAGDARRARQAASVGDAAK